MKRPAKASFSSFLGLGLVMLAQSVAFSAHGQDSDLEQGRKLASQCVTCHGRQGLAQVPIAPNIAGEPTQYLTNQLIAYKNADREHEIMSVVATTLDDGDITLLAQWYGSQSISAMVAKGAEAPGAVETCTACHGVDGIAVSADTPHLAGESIIYLDTQLKAFRAGRRIHPIMSPIAAEMNDDQIRQASMWYSAIELVVDP